MKKVLLLFFLLPFFSIAQEFQWVNPATGGVKRMDTDREGNVFSIGDGSFAGNLRGYISKFDKNGNLEWKHELYTKRYSGVRCKAVKTDSEGNCVVTFTFRDTFFLENYYFVNEEPASLILKLKKNGDLIWHYIISGSLVNWIEMDYNNNIYLVGSAGLVIFPDTTLQSHNNNDYNYFLKLDKNGEYQWVKQGVLSAYHNYSNETFSYMAFFTDSITFNGTTYYDDDYTETGFLLVGADKNYSVKWSKQFTTEYKTRFSVMGGTVDNNGNIFISGHHNKNIIYDGSIMFKYNPEFHGLQGIFLSKFDTLGNLLWSKSAGSPSLVFTEGITADTSGNVFITGYFKSEMTIEDTTIYSSGSSMFLARFDKDGNLTWLTKAEGGGSTGTAMTSDNKGNVYFGGKYGGEVSFGSHTLSGSGMFVGKYGYEEKEPVSVKEAFQKEEGSLSIFPNPADGQLYIKYIPLISKENTLLQIFNSTGSLIYSHNFSYKEEEYLKSIDISGFSQGVYFLNVVDGEERVSRKFVAGR